MTADEIAARIDAALQSNDIAAAATLAVRALEAGAAPSPLLLNLAAWQKEQAGDYAAAQALLHQALKLSPGDPLVLAALGGVARQQGDLQTALCHIAQALVADPSCAPAWLERGFALDAGGSIRAARDSFARAAALDPHAASAWGGLAHAAARLGDHAAAQDAAARALALNPQEPLAVFGFARSAIDGGDAGAAAGRLEALLSTPVALDNQIVGQALLGDASSRLGEVEAAYTAYARANVAFGERHGSGPPEGQTDFVRRIEAGIAAVDPACWRNASADTNSGRPPRHVFVVGFPRSGTTLMENILASLPGAHALEERPTLQAADLDFLLPQNGIEAFAALPDADLIRYREAYWNAVFAAGVPRNAALFVDMDPMKSLRLALIARLFPDARIVFMRRDPRDVVWSCFRTAFAPSSAAFEFVTLERTARLYDAVMRLIQTSRARLPLHMHEVRYEHLVADFEAETRRLCAAIGVQWTEDLLRFDRTAQRRGVSTASVGQVRRGLYDGSGQWRPFAAYLDPVMPILEPWL